MEKLKHTLTIAIPVFNEAKNIATLLKTLLNQTISQAKLVKIIVISDGSTDTTKEKITTIRSKFISYIEHKDTKGKATRLDEVFKLTNSDILVTLDGDVHIRDKHFVDKLISPIIKNKAEHTSAQIKELPAKSFIGKVLNASMHFKREMFLNIDHGNNIYTCHGRARAFSKKIYKKISFKKQLAEDAYSYLYGLCNKFAYGFVSDAVVYYKLPENLNDHIKQSRRFIKSKSQLMEEFSKKLLQKAYKLPKKIVAIALVKTFIKQPSHIAAYIFIVCYSIFTGKKTLEGWGTAHSTK